MSREIEPLVDYEVLRHTLTATMFVTRVEQPTLVLGSRQPADILHPVKCNEVALRRRRGGGGLVLLTPNDLWIDWWIPQIDSRWSHDVQVSSIRAGRWWAKELRQCTPGRITVHEKALEGDPSFRVVCFAGRGPGEVFIDDCKAVGLTQWRVREGILLSTVLVTGSLTGVVDFLNAEPIGLRDWLAQERSSPPLANLPEALTTRLCTSSGPWRLVREVLRS